MSMLFHGYFRSSAAWRCRIAFGLKAVSPDFAGVHLRRGGGEQHQPDYKAMNPQGLVPTLTVDGQHLTQSLAIIEWLDETIPNPPLLPTDAVARAEVRAFALAITADTHPLNNLRVLSYLKETLGHTQEQVDDWYRHWCHEGLAACEALASRSARKCRFTFGDQPGLADICLIPQMAGARRFGCNTKDYQRLSEIEAACAEIPAFMAAAPGRQPDAEA